MGIERFTIEMSAKQAEMIKVARVYKYLSYKLV